MEVLLVDDMLAIRALLRVYLMGFKFTFVEAKNGAEALIAARNRPPGLIITDVQMPVMDGIEMLESVRADPTLAHLPVIVLSSADERENPRVKQLDPARTSFALKPINPAALQDAVRKALRLGD